MGDVPGPKSLIILSQGLMLEGSQGEVTTLATLAAESRVNINVLMFSPPIGSAAEARVSETPSQDRDLREAGLETLAWSLARHAVPRGCQSANVLRSAEKRDLRVLLLGVEPAEKDRDGKTASDPRAGWAQQRAGARTPSGEICGPYAEYLVPRRVDGPRAAVAVGEHGAADAPVHLHLPRRSRRQGEGHPGGRNRSRKHGEGARSRDRLCDVRSNRQGGAQRSGAEDLLGQYRPADSLRDCRRCRSRAPTGSVWRRSTWPARAAVWNAKWSRSAWRTTSWPLAI